MKIDVRICGLNAPAAVRNYATHRAYFRLSRFGEEVASVTISITDVNGPKGGLDTRCRVRVRGPRLKTVVLESLSHDAFCATADALERAQRTLRRELSRRRDAKSSPQHRAS